MAFWNRKPPVYDRTKILEAAEKARSRGRALKAITQYQKILAVDPEDAQVNARIAPLLFKTKQVDAAKRAFDVAAQSYETKGFVDKALSVHVQAAALFPLDERRWITLAEVNTGRGRKADAVKVLIEGAGHLARHKPHRESATALLERALALDGTHLGATIALARVLAKLGRKKDGLARMDALAEHLAGPGLKKLRAAQLRLSPTPRALWRWFRAGSGERRVAAGPRRKE